MKMKIRSLILALVLGGGCLAMADILEEGRGIIYGKDHAFSLQAPKGWVLDNESAVQQGLHAVFYPKGESWADSTVMAYARGKPKTADMATAEDVAKAVVKDFQANGSPNYASKHVKTLKTDSGREAIIYHFTGDEFGNTEAVAYFVEEKSINFLVFNSRDPKVFADSLDVFEALAKSYVFIGDKVDSTSPKPEDKPKGADKKA